MADLVSDLCAAYAWQRALGHEVIEAAHCRIVRDPAHPDVWDANHVSGVRAAGAEEIEAVMRAADAALARVAGADCAYGAGALCDNGVGMVEDLFTLPARRRRGVATAIIARAVADLRRRGAGPVLIGAHAGEPPKRLYAALGFAPVCVTREYVTAPSNSLTA